MNNEFRMNKVGRNDDISTGATEDLIAQFDYMPRPVLNHVMRQRIKARMVTHMAQITATDATAYRMPSFPVTPMLRLTASIAIFVIMLYQFGIPAIHSEKTVTSVYPIQRTELMHDVRLVSIYLD